jgi:ribosome biogenesis GTPase / thiamine phosphate phosphatase
MSKKRKIRVDLRKNRSQPPRARGWTRDYQEHGFAEDDATPTQERIRAKGDLSRRRTIITDDADAPAGARSEMPAVDLSACLPGRVLRVHGLYCAVVAEDGRQFNCAVRRVLRNLVIDERNIVATGDRVWFRPEGAGEGVIERVEPRHGMLTRASRQKEHVLVANVDQLVIVTSLAEPALKPHLIDRYLVSAEQGQIAPIVCVNKADLADAAEVQPLVGMYTHLGVTILLTSAVTGQGIAELRERLKGRQTVFSGQSGVGKSSLLNAVQPDLDLKVREVSETNQKGQHTTTTAELIPLASGGWVVDTPGIRQFDIWNVIPVELEGFFPEFHPFVPLCRFPDCLHVEEAECAIKEAVREHRIAIQRYESYVGLYAGKLDEE